MSPFSAVTHTRLIGASRATIGHLSYLAVLRGEVERRANGSGTAPHPKLVVDVLEMSADSGRRNEELSADLPVR